MSRPRRRHSLRHQTNAQTPPPSPFISPLRFAAKKRFRFSPRRSSKSPEATNGVRMSSSSLPMRLPLESTAKDMLWDENDEDYPEVPKSPKPQHHGNAGSENDDASISSVSSGSSNGEIRIPLGDDESYTEQIVLEEFPSSSSHSGKKERATKKKMGKLLGHGRRLLGSMSKKNNSADNKDTTIATPIQSERSPPPPEQEQPMPQEVKEVLQQQQQPPLSNRESQIPPRSSNHRTKIRIKRQRKVQPQQQPAPDESSPLLESPRKQSRQIAKIRHRAVATPVRSDAIWAQTILGDPTSNDDEDEEEGEVKKNLNFEDDQEVFFDAKEDLVENNNDILAPKTPPPASTPPKVVTEAPLADLPNLNDQEKEEDHKMETTVEPTLDPNAASIAATLAPPPTPPGEDGEIVDEDDLLHLISDEEKADGSASHGGKSSRDNSTADRDFELYYLQQCLSDDDDEEGGVVDDNEDDELDLNLILEQPNNSQDSGFAEAKEVTPSNAASSLMPRPENPRTPEQTERKQEPPQQQHQQRPQHQQYHDKIIASPRMDKSKLATPLSPSSARWNRDWVEKLDGAPVGHSPKRPLHTVESGGEVSTTPNDLEMPDPTDPDEKPLSIFERSSLTNMQHRLLSMKTIKDAYKRKLLMQEQETVQLQVQLLASQFETSEAQMMVQNAETALMNQQAKLQASDKDREHQKALLGNLQEQLSLVQTQLTKSQEMNLKLQLAADSRQDGAAAANLHQTSDHSDTLLLPVDSKIASMEEQLLVQDEEMDQLVQSMHALKRKNEDLEVAKADTEQNLKDAMDREELLKAKLSEKEDEIAALLLKNEDGVVPMETDEAVVPMETDDEAKSKVRTKEEESGYRQEIQRLKELLKTSKAKHESESEVLRKQLEDFHTAHESEMTTLRQEVETSKQLVDKTLKDAQTARTEMLQEMAESKLEHTKAMEELQKSLSNAHEEEKNKLRNNYANELERLEEEIVSSRSELSV